MIVQDIVTELGQRIPTMLTQDTAIPGGNILNWLNEGIRAMSRRHPWTFLRQHKPLVLAVGGQVLDLPGEPIDPTGRLTVTDTSGGQRRIQLVDDSVAQSRYIDSDTGSPVYYTLQIKDAGTDPGAKQYQIKVYPIADSNGPYNLTVMGWFYLPTLPDKNADNRFTIDMPYTLMEWAMMRARQHANQYDRSQTNEQNFERMIEKDIVLDVKKAMELKTHLATSMNAGVNDITQDWSQWHRGEVW